MEKHVDEGIEILKKLSPKNQAYFMTMLRLAEAAEEGAKNKGAFSVHEKLERYQQEVKEQDSGRKIQDGRFNMKSNKKKDDRKAEIS